MGYRVHLSRRIAETPCLPLAVRVWAELLEEGLASHRQPDVLGSDAWVIWVEEEESYLPVGFLLYDVDEPRSSVWIRLAGVEKAHRGRGIYQLMWHELVAVARREGLQEIAGGVHAGNLWMQKAARKSGRHLQYSVWRFEVADQ
jgi:GNAT superfamily N-acetyltransferase